MFARLVLPPRIEPLVIEKATIFIPDISGFTAFYTRTELEHSSHILNELLEVLVESNCTDCTLAEVEGDALLFYRKGQALPYEVLIRQCLDMFEAFHTRLKFIERDSICPCGACQTASDLTLKFVVHYGTIKELRIARFTKASGLDMIIAHRLLKNSIPSDEYILATEQYLGACLAADAEPELAWQAGEETYPAIGRLAFRFALLDPIRARIADPPPRRTPAYRTGPDTIAVEIERPLSEVYLFLVDLENRTAWIPGLMRGEGTAPIDRLGVKHLCVFEQEPFEIVPLETEVGEESIRYTERSEGLESGLVYVVVCLLERKAPALTRLVMRIGEEADHSIPSDVMDLLMAESEVIAESFKVFCESETSE